MLSLPQPHNSLLIQKLLPSVFFFFSLQIIAWQHHVSASLQNTSKRDTRITKLLLGQLSFILKLFLSGPYPSWKIIGAILRQIMDSVWGSPHIHASYIIFCFVTARWLFFDSKLFPSCPSSSSWFFLVKPFAWFGASPSRLHSTH